MTAKERLEEELLPVIVKENTGDVQSSGFSEKHGENPGHLFMLESTLCEL